MIHITGKWYLDADTYNVTLYRKETAKTGKKAGEDYFKEECYPRDFRQAIDTLVEKKVRMAIKQSDKMEQLAKKIDEIHKDMNEFCDKYEDQILKGLRGDK